MRSFLSFLSTAAAWFAADPRRLWPAWLLLTGLVLFGMMGIDKRRAVRGKFRIPEKRLFLFALLGGGIGGTAGMLVFHHKTRKWYFAAGFPLIAVLQAALCIFLFLHE